MLHRFTSSLLLSAMLLAGAAHSQTTFYVDALNGSDTAPGTQASPFQSLSFGVLQLNNAGGGTLMVERGVYDAPSESFPIQVSQPISILGTTPCGARVRHPLVPPAIPNTVFAVTSNFFEVRDIEITTGHRGVQHDNAGTDFTLALQNVRIAPAAKALAANVSAGRNASITIEDCKLAGVDAGVVVRCSAGSNADLDVRRSTIGGTAGLFLRPHGSNSSLQATLESSIIHRSTFGIQSIPSSTGMVTTVIDHCTFYGNGAIAAPAAIGGAIVDGNSRVSHTVRNCIFDSNVSALDMPQYTPTTYALFTNMVQQANLIGVNGNMTGTPLFADPNLGFFGDYHILPGSSAIDAAASIFSSGLDRDGDPRFDCSGTGTPDLGADEFESPYIYFPDPPSVGGTAQLKVIGVPGEVWFAMAGTGPIANPPVCTNQLSLINPTLPPPFFGTIPANGLAVQSVTFPANPNQLGAQIPWQAALADAVTFLVTYTNVHVQPLCN